MFWLKQNIKYGNFKNISTGFNYYLAKLQEKARINVIFTVFDTSTYFTLRSYNMILIIILSANYLICLTKIVAIPIGHRFCTGDIKVKSFRYDKKCIERGVI